jgi:ribosome-associated heat shock protein Hsp15
MTAPLKVRIDKYLWSIRIYKTRTLAAAACEQGKVRLLDQLLKPSKNVQIGDRYSIKTEAREWDIEVTGLIDKRVAYPEAIKHYIDHTPEEKQKPEKPLESAFAFFTGKRQSKQGRPTKRERRRLDDYTND